MDQSRGLVAELCRPPPGFRSTPGADPHTNWTERRGPVITESGGKVADVLERRRRHTNAEYAGVQTCGVTVVNRIIRAVGVRRVGLVDGRVDAEELPRAGVVVAAD